MTKATFLNDLRPAQHIKTEKIPFSSVYDYFSLIKTIKLNVCEYNASF